MLQREKFANALAFLAGHVTRMQEKLRGFVDRSLVQPQQTDRVGNSIGLKPHPMRERSCFKRELFSLTKVAFKHGETTRRLRQCINPLFVIGGPADEFGTECVALRVGPRSSFPPQKAQHLIGEPRVFGNFKVERALRKTFDACNSLLQVGWLARLRFDLNELEHALRPYRLSERIGIMLTLARDRFGGGIREKSQRAPPGRDAGSRCHVGFAAKCRVMSNFGSH